MQDRKPLKTRTYVHEPSLFARENLFYVKMAGEYHRVSDYRIERERMESLLVIYVTEGELTVCLGGKLMTAPAGSIVLLDCRRPHSYFSRQPVTAPSACPYTCLKAARFSRRLFASIS